MQPILLAALASSALRVSNLTNLIVTEHLGAGPEDFLIRLGPASLAAVLVGWLGFRRSAPDPAEARPSPRADDAGAWRLGLAVVGVLTIGFTAGDAAGVEPWVTTAVVLVILTVVTAQLPLTALPLGAIVVAAGLAVLSAAASPHLGLSGLLGGRGLGAESRALVVGIIGADAINNLPALLVGLPHLETAGTAWAYLAGVNFGPVLWAGGSLAGLLWLDTMSRFGVTVTPREYARVGIRVGTPALVVAALLVLATGRLL
jgi:arsenical pump membrane protein